MTKLKKIGVIINIIAKIIIGLYLFDWTIAQFIPIEFTNNKISQNINLYSIYILPVSIILTLFGLFNRKREKIYIIGRIILTITASFLLIFILTRLSSIIMLLCVNNTGTILFENKINNSIKIVERHEDAGLFGEGPIEISKIRPLTKWFIISTKIDTTKIDRIEWKRINRR